jgi:SGNH hydrolase-like domain, acetyltransferase AlgX
LILENKIVVAGKKIIFFGLLLFLFIPLIQNVTHLKKYIHKLDGAFYPEQDIAFSWPAWYNGSYQEQKDKYIKENFGFHNYYVRLNCQINFSLFKKANASYVVVGRDNYLYETAYIDAYYGRDFIGQDKINDYITKLKQVQDTLQKLNKLILVVFAPGKACFYPEYIPENYTSEKTITNYEGFIKSAQTHQLNHIDFYKYFRDQKQKSKYPLYPQLGIHWSNYGSTLAFDSLVRYVENKLNLNLPDINIGTIKLTDSLQDPDGDAVKSLNLLKRPNSFQMAYPEYKINYDSLKDTKLNLLSVSDSFWWHIYGSGLADKTFGSSRFWFYNEEMYPESHTSSWHVSQVDYAAKIREADVILLMHSEATLHKFGGGFVDMCHEAYLHPKLKKEKTQNMKEKIRASPEWYNKIIEKAAERNLTVDSMLTLDALYILDRGSP